MNKLVILTLSPAFFFLAYDLIFYIAWIPSGGYSDIVVDLMIFNVFFNAFLFILTAVIVLAGKGWGGTNDVGFYWGRDIGDICFLSLIGVAFFSIVMQVGGDLSLNFNEKYNEISSGGIFYIVVSQIAIFILLYDLYVGRPRLLNTLLVALLIFFTGITGGRSGVISLILLLFLIASKKFFFGFGRFIAVIILLCVFFVFASIFRGTINLSGEGETIGFLDFNQIFTLEETVKYVEGRGGQFRLFLVDIVNGFVPRSLNPDKMTSTAFTREVFPDVSPGTSYTSGFYANLLFVFGYLGVVAAPFFQAAITSLYLSAVKQFPSGGVNFMMIYFLTFPISIVRGGIFEFRMMFALFLIFVAICAHKFLSSKFIINRKLKR
jgi:hypothetical protein